MTDLDEGTTTPPPSDTYLTEAKGTFAKEPGQKSALGSPFTIPDESLVGSGLSRNEEEKYSNLFLDNSYANHSIAATLHGTQLLQSKPLDGPQLTELVLNTNVFSSGLDDATVTGSLYGMIDPNSRRAIAGLIQTTKKVVHTSAATAFDALKKSIDDRKLFVMFEKTLDCNPKYDHLHPKSTLPIFSTFIEKAETSITNLILPQLYHEIELTVARTLESDLIRKKAMHEELEDLRSLLDRSREQLTEFESSMAQAAMISSADRKVLMQRILTLKEQLHWRGKLAPESDNVQYKPDYMEMKGSRRRSWYEGMGADDGDEDEECDQGTDKKLQYLKGKRLLQELEDNLKLLEQKIEEKRRLIAQLNAKREMMEAEIKRITAQLDTTDERQRQLRMLQKESDELDRLISQMHANYNEKMRDMEKLQKRYTQGLEEAEQRTAAMAEKLKDAKKTQKISTPPATSPGIGAKHNAEAEKAKKQIDELTKQMKDRDDEIERLMAEIGRLKEKDASKQASERSRQPSDVNMKSSPSTPRTDRSKQDIQKTAPEDPHLTTKISDQADEIARLKKQLQDMTEKLRETEAALQKEKEKEAEKVLLGDSPVVRQGKDSRKDVPQNLLSSTTAPGSRGSSDGIARRRSESRGPGMGAVKAAGKSLTPEEEELLRQFGASAGGACSLVMKARSVLRASLALGANGESTDAYLERLQKAILDLLNEKELAGLLPTKKEEEKDVAVVYEAVKAAKKAVYSFKDACIGVHNGADDSRRGSIGDDDEADGYNPEVNRASHAADGVLGSRRSMRKFQINYDSRATDLMRTDDVFNRLYNLAEENRAKLEEKKRAHLTELSEKEARKARRSLQAVTTMMDAINAAMSIIGRDAADDEDLKASKEAIAAAFTQLVETMLTATDHSSESFTSAVGQLKEQISSSLDIQSNKVHHMLGAPGGWDRGDTIPNTSKEFPNILVKQYDSSSQTSQTGTHFQERYMTIASAAGTDASAAVATNTGDNNIAGSMGQVQELTVQALHLPREVLSKKMINAATVCSPDYYDGVFVVDTSAGIAGHPFYIPAHMAQEEDLYTSSTLRSYPSRNIPQRASSIAGRIYLFDSSGAIVGIITPSGDVIFYGEYAQYSTQRPIVSDIMDKTCSLLSSRGSSRNSSRNNSRHGSAKKKDNDPKYTYPLQQVQIHDPAIPSHSCHSVLVQTDITLVTKWWPVNDLNGGDASIYRHKMVYNYRDIPLGDASGDATRCWDAKTPIGTEAPTAESTDLSIDRVTDGGTGVRKEPSAHDPATKITEMAVTADGKQSATLGIQRSKSCLSFSIFSREHTPQQHAADDSMISTSVLLQKPDSADNLLRNLSPNIRRANSEGMRARVGFRRINALTGNLDISARETSSVAENLTSMAKKSLINPEKIGSTIEKPAVFIYDTDTAPVRYRKTVTYLESIGGDPKDINIMAIVTESDSILRTSEAVETFKNLAGLTDEPPEGLNEAPDNDTEVKTEAKANDGVAEENKGDASNQPLNVVSIQSYDDGLSLSTSEHSHLPMHYVTSECSVNAEVTPEPEQQPYLGITSKSGHPGASTGDTKHEKVLSSFAALLKRRNDAFLVKSFDTPHGSDPSRRLTTDSQPLMTVKVVESLGPEPLSRSSGTSGKTINSEPHARAGTPTHAGQRLVSIPSATGTGDNVTPRLQSEDLSYTPVLENRCYLTNVTEKSMSKSFTAQETPPSFSTLHDSKGTPLIFNDRVVDSTGKIHSINMHKDGWESARESTSTRTMKQQAMAKIKTPIICPSNLTISNAGSRTGEKTPLSTSAVNPIALSVKQISKPGSTRGASASLVRKVAPTPEVMHTRKPLKQLAEIASSNMVDKSDGE